MITIVGSHFREAQTARKFCDSVKLTKLDREDSFHVLHRSDGIWQEFKLLGLTFDIMLLMDRGISIIDWKQHCGFNLCSVRNDSSQKSRLEVIQEPSPVLH